MCMAGLFLELEDKDCACRADGIIEICMPYMPSLAVTSLIAPPRPASLFIYPEARSRRYGREIMDYLEVVCVDEYRCKTITLKTRPFLNDETEEPNPTRDWYLRRGYVEYKVGLVWGCRKWPLARIDTRLEQTGPQAALARSGGAGQSGPCRLFFAAGRGAVAAPCDGQSRQSRIADHVQSFPVLLQRASESSAQGTTLDKGRLTSSSARRAGRGG